ncbi:MAG: hypothetical protein EAZ07_03825 [Cytophagales bacterium]|nr:MAG: hypothetical protein EAZ07_03825 [Cytophagales bacterium]
MNLALIKQKITRFFLFLLIIFLVVSIAIILFFSFANYSVGDRAGTIMKLSEKGYVFKTNEGELNLGMVYVEGSETSVNKSIWNFSLSNNTELINKMRQAMLSGERVRLTYKEKYFQLPWKGETKYLVTEMEIERK